MASNDLKRDTLSSDVNEEAKRVKLSSETPGEGAGDSPVVPPPQTPDEVLAARRAASRNMRQGSFEPSRPPPRELSPPRQRSPPRHNNPDTGLSGQTQAPDPLPESAPVAPPQTPDEVMAARRAASAQSRGGAPQGNYQQSQSQTQPQPQQQQPQQPQQPYAQQTPTQPGAQGIAGALPNPGQGMPGTAATTNPNPNPNPGMVTVPNAAPQGAGALLSRELVLTQQQVSALIGKGGANIQALRRATNSEIRIDNKEPGQNAVVTITGVSEQALDQLEAQVFEAIKKQSGLGGAPAGGMFSREMQVPSGAVGELIGRGGSTIERLRRTSGASILIPDTKANPVVVHISGPSPQVVDHAVRMVQETAQGSRGGYDVFQQPTYVSDPYAPGGGQTPPPAAQPFAYPQGQFYGQPPVDPYQQQQYWQYYQMQQQYGQPYGYQGYYPGQGYQQQQQPQPYPYQQPQLQQQQPQEPPAQPTPQMLQLQQAAQQAQQPKVEAQPQAAAQESAQPSQVQPQSQTQAPQPDAQNAQVQQ